MDEFVHARSSLHAIVSRMNQYHNKFKTPIGRLPLETLARIFEFVVAPVRDIDESSLDQPSEAHDLALVCKSWRIAALSWPRLWYHIIEDDLGLSDVRSNKIVLRRSGITPLHVFAQIPPVKRSVF
ncbi:hypothetical protein C8T65DRAFT_745795 [Cerioporus squamosus]|nr:hypothetical protein C8T65DRAFT_745795 [Cerioporus squamosus]